MVSHSGSRCSIAKDCSDYILCSAYNPRDERRPWPSQAVPLGNLGLAPGYGRARIRFLRAAWAVGRKADENRSL